VLMNIILAFMAIIRVLNHLPGTSGKSRFEIVFEERLYAGRARFFSQQNTTLNPYSPGNIAFASSNIVLEIVNHWVDYHVLSIIFGALPLAFWLATKGFKVAVSKSFESLPNGQSGKKILEKYNELKILTRSINSIWAPLVLNVLMELSFTIIWLHKILATGNIIWSVHFVLKFCFLQLAC